MNCRCTEFGSQLKSMADISARCDAESIISATLTDVVIGDWRAIRRCSVCGALWCQEFPYGEMQGGGPPCSYRIDTDLPDKWLKENEYLTARIRKEDEDVRFFNSIGPEIGPDTCRHEGCTRKTVRYSVLCQQHHFESIRNLKQP